MKSLVLLLLVALSGCATTGTRSSGPFDEDRLLDTIPEGVNVIVPVAYSRDGRRAAYAGKAQGVDRVVCGMWTGKAYAVV